MVIDRRSFLQIAAASWICGIPLRQSDASVKSDVFVGAYAVGGDEYRVGGFDIGGRLIWDFPLPARGHSFAVHPYRQTFVCFARRPGRFGLVVDVDQDLASSFLAIPAQRHFFGHGVFSIDGKFLYASENDFESQRGVIGIYSVDDHFSRIGEFDSYGIGPHDIRILSDDRTLVVANGGIMTHPAYPRTKLNLPTMTPSLCLVDRVSGELVQKLELDPTLHQLSIRHLAINQDDVVVVAMQYEGYRGDLVPLVVVYDPRQSNNQLMPLSAPSDSLRAMKQYCGSVCFDSEGRNIAVSAPRGNVVAFWNIDTKRFITSIPISECSAVAPTNTAGEFVAATGDGEVLLTNVERGSVSTLRASTLDQRRWDNHLTYSNV